jgi:pimeloyl-ACP methyl ester carboxylesterase
MRYRPRVIRSSLRLLLCVLALSACSERPPAEAATGGAPSAPAEPIAEELPDAREVTFSADDGVRISATLSPAASAEAPAVVLVHQLGSDRNEWAPLVARLRERPAVTTLAIDLRGHGRSTEGPEGAVLSYGAFDDTAWAATALDVRAAVSYLAGGISGERPAHIAAVGASIGATAVLAAAAGEPRIEHIVALSPGRAYHGFDGITPALTLGDRTFLGIVAAAEEENVETNAALARIMHSEPIVIEGTAHGVGLFAADPTTLDRVETFLRAALGAPRASE